MHLLKKTVLFIMAAGFFSCSPMAPITPGDSLDFLRKAYLGGDVDSVMKVLSSGSLDKIKTMNRLFASMSQDQAASLAARYGLPEQRLRSMTTRDGVILLMFLDPERNSLARALKSNPVSHARRDKAMVFRMANGTDLVFVREGPYWKLDMTDL